jgi:hypothetical protein
LRAVDFLGLAAAALITLLALPLQAWSLIWWAAVSLAAVIAVAAIAHMAWNGRDRIKNFFARPAKLTVVFLSIGAVGILVLGFIASIRIDISETTPSDQTSSIVDRAPLLYSGPIQSTYGKFLFQCNAGPPVPDADARWPQTKEMLKSTYEIWGDVIGMVTRFSQIRGGFRIEYEATTEEAKDKMRRSGSVPTTKIAMEVRRVGVWIIVTELVDVPDALKFMSIMPPDPKSSDMIAMRRQVEAVLGFQDGKCSMF